jgi:hypothetical protein
LALMLFSLLWPSFRLLVQYPAKIERFGR